MLLDLASHETPRTVATDTLIIGAGVAGLLLASRLRMQKVRVAILESGGRAPSEGLDPLNRVLNVGEDYRGATEGRARCLGGTSTMWGGAMIPFLAEDLAARPHLGLPAWPITLDELMPFIPQLESVFGIDGGPYDIPQAGMCGGQAAGRCADSDFITRIAKWPVFKRRNVATLFRHQLETDPDLSVWLNATATSFEVDEEAGRITSVVAVHPSGNTLRIGANNIVVCAGAIEATRLLLLLNRHSRGRIFDGCSALGHYFHDHLSVKVADITASDSRALNRLAGYRFARATMHSQRFELSPSTQAAERVGSAFGHITFSSLRETGFDALRDVMRHVQRTGKMDVLKALRGATDLRYLIEAGYWRYVRGQLRWPEPACYQLRVVAEQMPRLANRIRLADERDRFDVPLAVIDWRVDPADSKTISAFARRFDWFWRRKGWTSIADLGWIPGVRENQRVSLPPSADIYHPAGTTRMGLDGKAAVVDRNLRTFAVPNLWVASTSTFPSGASANPTMMLMLFVLRLAEHLAKR